MRKNRILLGQMEPLFLGKATCSTGWAVEFGKFACDVFLLSLCRSDA